MLDTQSGRRCDSAGDLNIFAELFSLSSKTVHCNRVPVGGGYLIKLKGCQPAIFFNSIFSYHMTQKDNCFCWIVELNLDSDFSLRATLIRKHDKHAGLGYVDCFAFTLPPACKVSLSSRLMDDLYRYTQVYPEVFAKFLWFERFCAFQFKDTVVGIVENIPTKSEEPSLDVQTGKDTLAVLIKVCGKRTGWEEEKKTGWLRYFENTLVFMLVTAGIINHSRGRLPICY